MNLPDHPPRILAATITEPKDAPQVLPSISPYFGGPATVESTISGSIVTRSISLPAEAAAPVSRTRMKLQSPNGSV